MKNKFLLFGIIFALLVTSSIIVGFSYNNDEERAFTKSSQESTAITRCQGQEEKEKEVYVYITKTGKKYHKENCRYLKKSKIKITLKEACKRGYTPCKVCKPPQCPK